MRLKEIEARLAEIKEELNTRAAELTDEEITKLETEVTDLQEERTALLAAAEKRKKLLERIAAGEPTGGAGADTTLLRNFKGAGGAGAGEPEDKYDTTAYRKAFMNYVCRGVAIPAEYRAAETTTTADSGAVIPTTIMNEIIQKLESYGSIYAKVRKINVQGGVSIPIADLKPTAHWITEAKSSDDQKASAKNSVTFNYYGLECKISQSILANVVTLKMFTDLFVPMATEAMVKAIEIAIFNGTGEGQPLGVLKDNRVTVVGNIAPRVIETVPRAQAGKLGYDILLNERERLFGFYLYKGNDLTATNTEGNTPCIFSRDFDNVNEQEYTASIENCGNFIYVQGAADDDGSQPVTTVDGEGATGLDLVEVFCDATDIARKYQQGETEVTIPLNTYIAMLKTRGGAELENYGKNINFVSTINTNSNLKFKADFDLGDRITCKETKWGIQIDARITEVTETYQKGEETIEATFGDSLPTLVDQIRKVR